MKIGEKIRLLRKQKGISPERLGLLSDVSGQYIRKLEMGTRKSITLTTAQKLAKGLGVPVAALLDEEELKPGDYVDTEFKSFIINDMPGLDAQEVDWLRRTINMVRERKAERDKYQAGD